VGAIDLGGIRRRVALVLRDRERGDVYGYVMSGEGWWSVAAGELAGTGLRLTLVISPETCETTTIEIAGSV
jgi:hypothetical protein